MPLAMTRRARLARVLRTLRLPAAEPVPLASDSNDVWRIGSVVVRICWRGDRDRFAREAAVTAALPAGVPYPEVLGTGSDDDLSWQVTRAVTGVPLASEWPRLSDRQRRDAIHQLGRALAALHAHRFPSEVTTTLATPRPRDDTPSALIGADISPLPLPRALRMAEHVRVLPCVDPALIDDVEARLHDLAGSDPFATAPATTLTCVHGDAHPANVLWRDGRVAALLDFEWVRLGPPDLEIEPYLRADMGITAATDAERRRILGWLAESHPAAFAAPDLIARLWLYQLAFTLRQLLIHHPDRPGTGLPHDHPLAVLRRIVTGPDHLHQLLPHTHW